MQDTENGVGCPINPEIPANSANPTQPPNSRSARNRGVRCIEYVNQTQYITIEQLKVILETRINRQQITEYAFIVHDKDVKEDGEPVESHVHCMMRFRYVTKMCQLKSWFQCEENKFQHIRSAWTTALRYLTHKNSPEKYQYSDDEVVSNFPYAEKCEIRENTSKRTKSKAIPPHIQELLNQIASNEVSEKEYFERFTTHEFCTYRREIDCSLELQRLRKEKEARENPRRSSDNLYVYGASGLGKTYFAKTYCTKIYNEFFISGSSNDPLDGYKGEKSIIFDDIRPEDMTMPDYIKLTDPHNATAFRSRYKNKVNHAECLVMTTPYSPGTFIKRLKKHEYEEPKQFYRRHHTYINVLPDLLNIYAYDAETGALKLQGASPNELVPKEKPNDDDRFGQTTKVMEFIKRHCTGEAVEDASTRYTSQFISETACHSISDYDNDVIQECTHIQTPAASENDIAEPSPNNACTRDELKV